ncbi:MAG: OadG family protein [Tissierellia bacterium]|nr:OadG family protein [Tissierellia bacterium]
MGKDISIVDSLIISLVSMVAVFVVLAIIYYLVDLLKIVASKKNEKTEEPIVKEDLEDEELVAVIAAALAVSLGVSIPEVNIKSIKRISSTASRWAEVGRREQTTGKL